MKKFAFLMTIIFCSFEFLYAQDFSFRKYLEAVGFGKSDIHVQPKLNSIPEINWSTSVFTKGKKLEIDGTEKYSEAKIPERFCNGKEQKLEDAIDAKVEIKEELTTPGLKREEPLFGKKNQVFSDFTFDQSGRLTYINGKILNSDALLKLNEIVSIIPLDLKKSISRVEINYNAFSEVWAAVAIESVGKSKVEFGHGLLMKDNTGNFSKLYNIIHELGHVIDNLETTEVESGICKKNKGTPQRFGMCSEKDTIYGKYNNVFEGFRKKCPDYSNMVTEYSCDTPAEDFADHFANWVLDNDIEDEKPAVRLKYRFFETYPELVKYKKEIRALLPSSKFCK